MKDLKVFVTDGNDLELGMVMAVGTKIDRMAVKALERLIPSGDGLLSGRYHFLTEDDVRLVVVPTRDGGIRIVGVRK